MEGVIFLIDTNTFNRNMLGLMLERVTTYKVFSFFSVEESLLYWQLNPKLLIYNSEAISNIPYQVQEAISVIDLSRDIRKQKSYKRQDTLLVKEIASIISDVMD